MGVGFGVGQGVGVAVGHGDGVGVGGGVQVGFMVGVGQLVGVRLGLIMLVNVSSLGVAETKLSSTHMADATKMVRRVTLRSKIVILPFLLYVVVASSPFKQKSVDLTIKL